MLTVGSLFSGIGGIELGLERAGGFRTIWQCENDPWARAVLAKHWPGLPVYPDVRALPFAEMERPDVICGGFPCQDLSQAGKGAGLQGARSGLWFSYLEAVRALRPRYILVENVAILTQRGLDVVLGGLAASGYDAEWDCVPAAAVGAPHRRDRLFIVAYPAGERAPAKEQPGRPHGAVAGREDVADAHAAGRHGPEEGERREPAPPRRGGALPDPHRDEHEGSSQAGRGPVEGAGGPFVFGDRVRGGGWEPEPDVGRVAHGVPRRVDRLRGLGNAVVPQVAQYVGERILARERGLNG